MCFFSLLFRVLSDATLWRHSHRFVPSFISNSGLHGYSQNTRKGTHAALCSNALGCFTFRVTQKGVWGEEGSVESRHILGQPQSLSQFFPPFVLFIPSTFRKVSLLFSTLHTTYLSNKIYIKQSDPQKEIVSAWVQLSTSSKRGKEGKQSTMPV